MNIEYYCPICKSIEIDIICLTPPQLNSISMDELPYMETITIDDCVYRTNIYQAKCKNCGYSVDYQR